MRKEHFNPDKSYVEKAIEDYINRGGVIKRVVLDEESYFKFMQLQSENSILDF